MNLRSRIHINPDKLALLLIVIFAFGLRAYNLNYNSPFQDEAIYVVIGRLGLFHGDWDTLNPVSWMAGQPYIYPSLAATTYMAGGITASRLLTVLFGAAMVALTYRITWLLSHPPQWKRTLAASVAAVIVAASAVTLHISRLATYDALSYLLLLAGFLYLIRADQSEENLGKLFFIAGISLILSVLTKFIAALFIPIALMVSYTVARRRSKEHLFFWKRYFFWPVLVAGIAYAGIYAGAVLTYGASQMMLEQSSMSAISGIVWQHTGSLLLWYTIGSLGMFVTKRIKLWLILTAIALTIIAVHTAMLREATLEKHLALTVTAIAVICGIGTASLLHAVQNLRAKTVAAAAMITILLAYSKVSYGQLVTLDHSWKNSSAVAHFLASRVRPGNTILTEEGPAVMLAAFEKSFPAHVTTFDWFEYQKQTGPDAYRAAVEDGYFTYIEIKDASLEKEALHENISNLIAENLQANYTRTHKIGSSYIYERKY